MAQTGYTPIKHYKSGTALSVPLAANLNFGELAINYADGKLFYKDSSGVVQVIGTKGGVGSSSTTQVLYNSSGAVVGSANMTFNGTVLTSSFAGPLNGTVGATTASTGAFTTLSASSTVSGTGFSTYLASPPAIGGTAAAAGAFTTLSASSTVSGTGFNSSGIIYTPAGTGAVATTVQANLRQYVSVQDFGAVGDGVTNNTAAIQAAINAVNAAGGGEVSIPAGSYLSGALTLKDKVSIVGVGVTSKFVAVAGAYNFFTGTSLTNLKLSDFYVDLTAQTSAFNGMYITGIQNSEISGVTIYNAAGFGWLIFTSVRCKYLRNTINTTRQWDGMTITTGSVDNVIEGNTVFNSYDSGIGFTDTLGTVCVGNYVKRQKVGGVWYAPGIDAAGAKNAVITGNYVIGNKFGISLLQHSNSGKQCKRVAVSGNTIADGEYGINCGPVTVTSPVTDENVPRDSIVISGNTIFSQDVAGIAFVGAASGPTTINNTISSNIIGYSATGISLNLTSSTSVLSNQLHNNTTGLNSFSSTNINLSLAFNVFENNTTNWSGTAGTGTTYVLHNKNLAYPNGTYNHEAFASNWDFGGKLQLGNYYLWVDSSGRLRIKNGVPTSDTDGTVVGTQT